MTDFWGSTNDGDNYNSTWGISYLAIYIYTYMHNMYIYIEYVYIYMMELKHYFWPFNIWDVIVIIEKWCLVDDSGIVPPNNVLGMITIHQLGIPFLHQLAPWNEKGFWPLLARKLWEGEKNINMGGLNNSSVFLGGVWSTMREHYISHLWVD